MGCCASVKKADLSQQIEELETRVEADKKALDGLRSRDVEMTKTVMTSKTMCGTLRDRIKTLKTEASVAALEAEEATARINRSAYERDEALRERDEALHAKNETTCERDEALRAKNEATCERDEALRERDEALRAKNEVTCERDEALRAKNEATCERDEALRERDEALRAKNEVTCERDEALRERDEARREAASQRESRELDRSTHASVCKALRDDAAHAASRAEAELTTANTRMRVMDTTLRRLVSKLKRERRLGRARIETARAYRIHMSRLYHDDGALEDLVRRICPTAMPPTVRTRYQRFGRALLGAVAAEVRGGRRTAGGGNEDAAPPSPDDKADDGDGDGDEDGADTAGSDADTAGSDADSGGDAGDAAAGSAEPDERPGLPGNPPSSARPPRRRRLRRRRRRRRPQQQHPQQQQQQQPRGGDQETTGGGVEGVATWFASLFDDE